MSDDGRTSTPDVEDGTDDAQEEGRDVSPRYNLRSREAPRTAMTIIGTSAASIEAAVGRCQALASAVASAVARAAVDAISQLGRGVTITGLMPPSIPSRTVPGAMKSGQGRGVRDEMEHRRTPGHPPLWQDDPSGRLPLRSAALVVPASVGYPSTPVMSQSEAGARDRDVEDGREGGTLSQPAYTTSPFEMVPAR